MDRFGRPLLVNATITGDPGATFYYTTDGSTPTTSSTQYTAPFAVTIPVTIKAIEDISGTISTVSTATIYNDTSSVNVPRTGLVLWLKADYGVTLSGSNVTNWTDISASTTARTITIPTGGGPTFLSAAANGLPALSFNGTQIVTSSDLGDLSKGITIFLVLQPTVTSATNVFFTTSSFGYDGAILSTSPTVFSFSTESNTTVKTITTPASTVPSAFQLIGATENGASSGTINLNTITTVTGALENLRANIARTGSLGWPWKGQIAEIMVFTESGPGSAPVAVTQSTLAQAQAYLSAKYQTSTTIATPPPTFNVPAGTLAAPTYVAISAPPGATIFITQNGTTPTTSSPQYLGPVNIGYSQTLSAIAVANGVSSSVQSAAYVLNSTQWPAPSALNTTAPSLNLQLPTVSIPQ